MKIPVIVLLAVQCLIFAAVTCWLGILTLFWDAPDTYATIWLKIIAGLVPVFGILVAVGATLSKRSPLFMLLPLVATVPELILLHGYHNGSLKIAVSDHPR